MLVGGAQTQRKCRVLGGLREAAGSAPRHRKTQCWTHPGAERPQGGRRRCRVAAGRSWASWGIHLGRWGRPRGGGAGGAGPRSGPQEPEAATAAGCSRSRPSRTERSRIARTRAPDFGTERGEPRARSRRTSLGLPGTGAAAGRGGFSDTVPAVGAGAGIRPGLPPGGRDAGTPSQVNPGPASSLASSTPWPGTRSWGDKHF